MDKLANYHEITVDNLKTSNVIAKNIMETNDLTLCLHTLLLIKGVINFYMGELEGYRFLSTKPQNRLPVPAVQSVSRHSL